MMSFVTLEKSKSAQNSPSEFPNRAVRGTRIPKPLTGASQSFLSLFLLIVRSSVTFRSFLILQTTEHMNQKSPFVRAVFFTTVLTLTFGICIGLLAALSAYSVVFSASGLLAEAIVVFARSWGPLGAIGSRTAKFPTHNAVQ